MENSLYVAWECEGPPADSLQTLQIILAVKRSLPTQKHVSNDSDTPHVARRTVPCRSVRIERQDFVRNVVGRAQHCKQPTRRQSRRSQIRHA